MHPQSGQACVPKSRQKSEAPRAPPRNLLPAGMTQKQTARECGGSCTRGMKSEPDTPGGGGRSRGQRQRWGGRKRERGKEKRVWESVTRDGEAGAVSLEAELQMAREWDKGAGRQGPGPQGGCVQQEAPRVPPCDQGCQRPGSGPAGLAKEGPVAPTSSQATSEDNPSSGTSGPSALRWVLPRVGS